MHFTQAELEFLRSHKLGPDDVFVQGTMARDSAKAEAKRAGKTLILGTPCRALSHRLRTRAGHCVECDPKKLAMQLRMDKPAFVYIAHSRTKSLI